MKKYCEIIRPITTIIILLFAATLFSCAHIPSEPPKTYQIDETANLLNIEFKINSVDRSFSFANFVGQRTYAKENFIIVDMTSINRRKQAIPFHLRPIFVLEDDGGAIYKPSDINTAMINMGQGGVYNPVEDMNPNVRNKCKIVFDVPDGKYKFRVLVPYRAQVSFGGYNEMTGPYLYYELSH